MSRSISAAIASASSSESTRFPSCSTASQRTPTPSDVVRSAALRDRARAGPRRTPPRRTGRPPGASAASPRGRGRAPPGSSRARRARARARSRPSPSGWTPCVTCASWSGSPSSTSRCAAVPQASVSARLYWPASSTTSVSSWPSSSSREWSQAVPATSSTSGSRTSSSLPGFTCALS